MFMYKSIVSASPPTPGPRPQGWCVVFRAHVFTFSGGTPKLNGVSLFVTFYDFFACPSAQIHNSTTNPSP